MGKLSEQVKVVQAVAPTAGSPGTMTATEVNATGYNSALFVVHVGVMTSTATLDARVQTSTTSGGTFANTTGAALTQVADTGGGKVYLIDMPVDKDRPFLKLVVITATAAAINGGTCMLYNPAQAPASQSAAQTIVV